MRSPTPRQWTGIALAAVALPALTATAWPLIPFLAGLAPEALPLGRTLWGLFFAAVLVAAAVLVRSQARWGAVWLGWLILTAWTAAIAVVAGVVLVVWLILGSPGLKEVRQLTPTDLDAIATRAFAIVAGLGGVALLVIAYRRQRTIENGEQREVTKLFNERFTTAYTELGNEQAAVRLGAVHALAHLADDAPPGREDLLQMVIDVLCAYLRMPYTPAPGPLPENATDEQAADHRDRELEFASFREVRHTVIRIIGDRLRKPTRWRGKDYDFTGTVFDGGDLTGANFTDGRVDFTMARFTGGMVNFRDANFTGGTVSFIGANFTGGIVSFIGARFRDGMVNFDVAAFTGGMVHFGAATFTGGRVNFGRARFAGGTVDFGRAEGACPTGLVDAIEKGEPEVVALPASWRRPDGQNDGQQPPETSGH
ncbi:pentapeptide repeat-containing protein [Nocardiopsis sp. RSe5-2]|uniref:Pentapeptide repeat-containing protein n=1 Tax=Nocardiopsis endophytica TaxID=3018445 RepID=A0ABT4TYX1_9ACTN|nr:pentapeptide repeat-containing protein [Nocardiopsis endophytica]MDA2809896.1 pentapeptide repeat-containing protein [Nocardiopsis endophytica]